MRFPDSPEVVALNGAVQVPLNLDSIPERGNIDAEVISTAVDKPLAVRLTWQQQDGHLGVSPKGEDTQLLDVPGRCQGKRLSYKTADGSGLMPGRIFPAALT